ncbi:hypothetical protein DVH05_010467 [Phytophthora capsici]|nr:hypothetical protein DVH05_010467 [Phytophthora capsici]
MKGILLPVLIETLQVKSLVIVLESLLILRHLAASHTLRYVLINSESLQTSLKWLRYGSFTSDGDLEALVAREARNLSRLVANGVEVAPKDNTLRNVIVAPKRAVVAKRRQLQAKAETLTAYGMTRHKFGS